MNEKFDPTRLERSQIPSAKRTEMISVRLAPKIRYAAEIAARSQRRTVSALIEVAVTSYLGTLFVSELTGGENERPVRLMKLFEELWDPEESDRFVNLAEGQRWLLNMEEELRWKEIRAKVDAKGKLTPEQRLKARGIYDEVKKRISAQLRESEGFHNALGR